MRTIETNSEQRPSHFTSPGIAPWKIKSGYSEILITQLPRHRAVLSIIGVSRLMLLIYLEGRTHVMSCDSSGMSRVLLVSRPSLVTQIISKCTRVQNFGIGRLRLAIVLLGPAHL